MYVTRIAYGLGVLFLYSQTVFADDANEPLEMTQPPAMQAYSDFPLPVTPSSYNNIHNVQLAPVPAQSESSELSKKRSAIESPSPIANAERYSVHTAFEDVKTLKWEGLGTFAGITALGVKSWDWGGSSFHFNNERWFGKTTGSGGADKLGHAFTSYAMTNAFAERLQAKGRSPERAALSASLLTSALMLYVEAFDGMSGDHGFSYEDVVMNSLGVGFAYLRQTNPRLKSLVDFRMEYKPSGYKGFRPLSDYEGQKYLLALKFSGFKSLKQTPLRYFELQAGYYARGFSREARTDGQFGRQQGFVGVGVNLTQLFFGYPSEQDRSYDKAGRFMFEHIQIPYTAAYADKKL